MLRQSIRAILLVLPLLFIFSCTNKKERIYTIGFSQCVGNDNWRKQMINEMKIEASFHEDIKLVIEDAQGNSELQVRQIQGLLNKKVDLLIISPNESKPITPIAQKAFKQGIPTILIDRKIDSGDYTSFIGSDNHAIGKSAALFLDNLTEQKMNVLEVWGLEGSSPARERHKGFIENLSGKSNLNLKARLVGGWLRENAFEKVKNYPELNDIQAIFAHNDEMALGAYEACVRRGIDTRKMIIVGVDALQGPQGGIQAVIDGKLTASLLYPTGGGKAIQVALDILQKKGYRKEYLLNTAVVDKTNAEILKLQSTQINDYLGKIENQLLKLQFLDYKYNNQRTLLYITVVLLCLAMFLAVLLYFAYLHMKRIYFELQQKNTEINNQRDELAHQREQLVEMNQKIEDVTAQKLRFFTNVSHELRTPLSLLISPIDRILEMKKFPEIHRELMVMKNNTDRLLRLITQLLDFRKIEGNEMKLYVKRQNIVSLVKSAKSAFNYQAHIKLIDYTVSLPCEGIEIYYDEDKIEKVLLNLLSNALKFTPKAGKIRVELVDDAEAVIVTVSDTGKGMQPEQMTKVFDRFYQGAGDYSSGTGIGLNLSKEFVELHGGSLTVESRPNEGSRFTIVLKKGTTHFNPETTCFNTDESLSKDKIFEMPVLKEVDLPNENLTEAREHTLLIVEDDDNLREYLRNSFRQEYNVQIATNGKEALQVLRDNEISLIVCDVMMPEMDGFEFCKTAKADLAISHIPIILLTALTGEEQMINGLSLGADDYLSKPFNTKQLQLKIRNLLSLKKQIKSYFKNEFFGSYAEVELDSSDKQFIKKVCSVLDENLSESDISIEKVSQVVGLSRIHMYRKIKEITGYSPSEFFKNYKVKKSLPLLAAKNLTISEIAYRCGFTSPSYYSKCFKEVLNISPTEYQMNH
jgi:Signal transduction histidine kinase